jgi:hypothetical protein
MLRLSMPLISVHDLPAAIKLRSRFSSSGVQRTLGITHRAALFDRNRHRLAFIDDMDGKKLERLVAGDFESAVRHIANVDFGCSRFQANLLAIGQQ